MLRTVALFAVALLDVLAGLDSRPRARRRVHRTRRVAGGFVTDWNR